MRADHLPFPMPERPHAMLQEWRSLTFLHWQVAPEALMPFIPDGLEVDCFDGRAYVGAIPFMMRNVRPRWAVSVPGISNFPEFNVRTYVRHNGKGGVLFLTLDAQSWITCTYAPRAYGLPYRYAKGHVAAVDETHRWASQRPGETHAFAGSAVPTGEPTTAEAGSLEAFLFERYAFFTQLRGQLCIAHTQHDPWVYREGRAELEENGLTESFSLGISDPLTPELVHLSAGVEVRSWTLEEVRTRSA